MRAYYGAVLKIIDELRLGSFYNVMLCERLLGWVLDQDLNLIDAIIMNVEVSGYRWVEDLELFCFASVAVFYHMSQRTFWSEESVDKVPPMLFVSPFARL